LSCRERLRSSLGDEPDPIERAASPLGIAGDGLLLPAPPMSSIGTTLTSCDVRYQSALEEG